MEFFLICFVIFIFALAFTSIITNKKNQTHKYRDLPPTLPQSYSELNKQMPEYMIRDNIIKENPNFSEDNFKRFVEMVYVRYLSSIMKRKPDDVKSLLHEELYKTHENYIDTIRIAKRNIHIENIIVNSITLLEYKTTNNVETIKVHIKSKMNQYETDDNNMVINGYRSRIVSKDDILTFQRDYNALYGKSIVCPHCGASLSSIKKNCDYCGTVVKFDDKTNDGWKLCDVTTL